MNLQNQIKEYLSENIGVGLSEIYIRFKVYSRRRVQDNLFEMMEDKKIGYDNKKFYLK